MISERLRVSGVIRGGVVVPDSRLPLPEGTLVEISFLPSELTQELQEEFADWERASDDAWRLIETWEQGPKP